MVSVRETTVLLLVAPSPDLFESMAPKIATTMRSVEITAMATHSPRMFPRVFVGVGCGAGVGVGVLDGLTGGISVCSLVSEGTCIGDGAGGSVGSGIASGCGGVAGASLSTGISVRGSDSLNVQLYRSMASAISRMVLAGTQSVMLSFHTRVSFFTPKAGSSEGE